MFSYYYYYYYYYYIITGEYSDPYYKPFYEIGDHLSHAIKQTNVSNHSCSFSGKLFFKKASGLAIKSLLKNLPQAGKA